MNEIFYVDWKLLENLALVNCKDWYFYIFNFKGVNLKDGLILSNLLEHCYEFKTCQEFTNCGLTIKYEINVKVCKKFQI